MWKLRASGARFRVLWVQVLGVSLGGTISQWFPAAVDPRMIILSCTPRPYSVGSGPVGWRGPGKRLRTAE